MSWHYLPALVAGSSEASSPASTPSARSRSKPSPERCFSDASGTACSPCSRSGTMPAPSMADPGVASWMSSLQASRASHSAPLARISARPTRAMGGPGRPGFLGRYDPASRSWRTSQISLLTNTSDEFSGIWPRSGMVSNGTVFRLRPSAPLTRETDSGFWLTPKASDTGKGEGQETFLARVRDRSDRCAHSLAAQVRDPKTWPTPRANDSQKRGDFDVLNPRNGLPAAVRRVPTPSAHDGKGSSKPGQRRRQLTDPAMGVIDPGGLLNPMWVEWLMGWPIGWTDLQHLEMARYQEWSSMLGFISTPAAPLSEE